MFGKNIIITDNADWTTSEIVEASLDPGRSRTSSDLARMTTFSMRPLRHWTDSKIRCHLFACMVAMTYLRRIEPSLRQPVSIALRTM